MTRHVHQSRRHQPRPAPAGVLAALVLILAVVAGCDFAGPAPSGSSSSAGPTRASTATASVKPGRSPATSSPGLASAPAPAATPIALPAIVGATQTTCPSAATTGKRASLTTGRSRNWAGYVVGATSGHVTCVEGTWTQPKLRCPSSGQTSVVIWVGIDGASAVGGLPDASSTLAQTGTTGDCDHGTAHYGAWFEFLPDLGHIVPMTLPIKAGDSIWAQVRSLGKGKFTATVINLTQRVGASKGWTLRQPPLLTAEWIVEDPATRCSGTSCVFATLARFSTVTITGAATINGHRYQLGSAPFPYLKTSIYRSSKTLASPSSLSSSGFSVVWKGS